MRMTDRAWRRETKRMPKWKELKEAYGEYKEKLIAGAIRKVSKKP